MNCSGTENRTECLLEAILSQLQEEGNKFDWDAITFGFTVLVGFVALVFAAVAIIPGLFAAGPGRIKSSWRVIGPWSELSEREFDWREFRYLTTAYTPIIDPSYNGGTRLQGRFKKRRLSLRADNYPINLHGVKTSPASWRDLLALTELDSSHFFAVKGTIADYLPPDLPAVPAYARVGTLFNLAAALGGNKIILDSTSTTRLPAVSGPGFQLRLREHPSLGMVAVFEAYKDLYQIGKKAMDDFKTRTMFESGPNPGFAKIPFKLMAEFRPAHNPTLGQTDQSKLLFRNCRLAEHVIYPNAHVIQDWVPEGSAATAVPSCLFPMRGLNSDRLLRGLFVVCPVFAGETCSFISGVPSTESAEKLCQRYFLGTSPDDSRITSRARFLVAGELKRLRDAELGHVTHVLKAPNRRLSVESTDLASNILSRMTSWVLRVLMVSRLSKRFPNCTSMDKVERLDALQMADGRVRTPKVTTDEIYAWQESFLKLWRCEYPLEGSLAHFGMVASNQDKNWFESVMERIRRRRANTPWVDTEADTEAEGTEDRYAYMAFLVAFLALTAVDSSEINNLSIMDDIVRVL